MSASGFSLADHLAPPATAPADEPVPLPEEVSEVEHHVDVGPCEKCGPVIDMLAARVTKLAAERLALLAILVERDAAEPDPPPGTRETYGQRVRRDPGAYRIAELGDRG